jgi:hypothetical protein
MVGMCSLRIQAYFRLEFALVKIAAMGRQSAEESESSLRP